MPSAQWMALGCYRKLVSDHAVKPPKKVLLLNPSCHVPSPTMSIPGLQRLFLSQYPCLNTLFPPDPLFQILPWTTGLFVLGPSLICYIMPLLIPGCNFTYALLGHFPDCPLYFPRILSSKIWVSVLNFWSSSFFWKEKDTHLIFSCLSAPYSSLLFPPNKRYFSISKQSFWIIWTKQPIFP